MASLKARAGCHAGPARAPARRFPLRRLAVHATAAPAAPAAAQQSGSAHYTQQVVEEEAKYVLQTYGRPSDIVFVKGQGSKLYDANGKEYLDFAAGIAVNVLGHSDARWYAALADQAGRLAHTSNLYHTAPQVGVGAGRPLPLALAVLPPGQAAGAARGAGSGAGPAAPASALQGAGPAAALPGAPACLQPHTHLGAAPAAEAAAPAPPP